MIDALKIIKRYYDPDSFAFKVLITHGEAVKNKALEIAGRLKDRGPDIDFIIEASLLHDIGIIFTDSPLLGCYGKEPYICHGYLGRELLEREGLPLHGLVAERHVGAGLTIEDIKKKGLPLPMRNMVPESIEEKIICVADKCFSKKRRDHTEEKPLDLVLKEIAGYGEERLRFFEALLRELRLRD